MDDFDDFDDLLGDAEDGGADTRDEWIEDLGEPSEIDPHDDPDLQWAQWEAALSEYVEVGQIDPEAIEDLREWFYDDDVWSDFMAEIDGDAADVYE